VVPEAGKETVFAHPDIVVELGQIPATAIGQEHNQQRVRIVDFFCHLERRPRGQTARSAGQNAFLAGEGACGQEGIAVGNLYPAIDTGPIEGTRPEILADPFDLIGMELVTGIDRALRIGADDRDGRVLLLQIARNAADGSPGADASNEMGDTATGLLPDLRTVAS